MKYALRLPRTYAHDLDRNQEVDFRLDLGRPTKEVNHEAETLPSGLAPAADPAGDRLWDHPQPTNTPAPTSTPEPFVGGECDPATDRVEMNTSLFEYVAGAYTYPEACSVYCLWVPDGSQLKIGISDFKVDLNLHVDVDLLVLEYGDDTRWESIDYGPVNELVYIPNPGGRYYIWVCTVDGSAMEFTLHNEFTP